MSGMPDTALADQVDLADPAAYPLLREVRPRYSDLDPDDHVGVLGVVRWFEDVRCWSDLPGFRRLLDDGAAHPFRAPLAVQRARLLAPIPADDAYRVGLGVRRIGTSSFTFGYGVFAGSRCLAVGDSVSVLVGSGGATALPDVLREDLARLSLDELGAAPPAPPGPERRRRSAYPFTVELRARISDVDTNHHVNNVALAAWYVDAVAALHLEAGGGPPTPPGPTAIDVQYPAEVTYPSVHTVGVAVTGTERGLARYACGLFRGDDCVGLADLQGPAAGLSLR